MLAQPWGEIANRLWKRKIIELNSELQANPENYNLSPLAS